MSCVCVCVIALSCPGDTANTDHARSHAHARRKPPPGPRTRAAASSSTSSSHSTRSKCLRSTTSGIFRDIRRSAEVALPPPSYYLHSPPPPPQKSLQVISLPLKPSEDCRTLDTFRNYFCCCCVTWSSSATTNIEPCDANNYNLTTSYLLRYLILRKKTEKK